MPSAILSKCLLVASANSSLWYIVAVVTPWWHKLVKSNDKDLEIPVSNEGLWEDCIVDPKTYASACDPVTTIGENVYILYMRLLTCFGLVLCLTSAALVVFWYFGRYKPYRFQHMVAIMLTGPIAGACGALSLMIYSGKKKGENYTAIDNYVIYAFEAQLSWCFTIIGGASILCIATAPLFAFATGLKLDVFRSKD